MNEYASLREICARGRDYGRSDLGRGAPVQVEFVSANPTGPISLAHGRGGVLGDVLASLLTWVGYQVSREFYVNDTGRHVARFGRSVEARFLQLLGRDAPLPEDGFPGDYVGEVAQRIREREGNGLADLPESERLERLCRLGCEVILQEQQATLARFGIRFDRWYLESDLHHDGKVDEVLKLLQEGGHVYEADGALWLRSTALGDPRDHPLLRRHGQPTYVAADLAYHLDKFRRGFTRVIDVWGPDHDGYVARTKAGLHALGCPQDQFEVLIHQDVRLFVDGELRVGSRRAGEIIPLDDILDEAGKDATRFLYLIGSGNSPFDFNLDLARSPGPENPVCAVRGAFARLGRVLREAGERGILVPDQGRILAEGQAAPDPGDLTGHAELALVRKLQDWPEEVRKAATAREPHRIARYVQELAATSDACCRACWGALPDDAGWPGLRTGFTAGRLLLTGAACIVFDNALTLLGVSMPEATDEAL